MTRIKRTLRSLTFRSWWRFRRRGLMRLLEAGWYQGREWEADELEAFKKRFPPEAGHPALEVLREFGGLDIGGVRGMVIGHMEEHHTHSREIIDGLAEARLYPVGWTIIYEDDGLAIQMDEKGRVYLDGGSGREPPDDQRLELVARNFDKFVRVALAPRPSKIIRMWHYHGEWEDDAGE